MASNGSRADSVVRVLVAGALDHGVTEQLKARSDLLFLESGRADDSDANKPDVVVYVAAAGYLLDNDVTVLRSWTNAPIVLATDAPRDSLVEEALHAGVSDVLILPQSADSIAFALLKSARSGRAEAGPEGHVITVMSPKGGTGKTVIATNLADALRKDGHRALLVDLDLQFGDGAIMIGAAPTATIHDLATDKGELDADKLSGFITEHESGYDLLAAPLRPEEADGVSEQKIARMLRVAASSYDVVVVDTSPQFDAALLAGVEVSDELLLLTSPEVTSLKNARVALLTLQRLSLDTDRISVVLNRAGLSGGLDAGEVSHALGRPVRFKLPNDPVVPAAVNRGLPVRRVDSSSRFARAVSAMAIELAPPRAAESNGSHRNGLSGALVAMASSRGRRAKAST